MEHYFTNNTSLKSEIQKVDVLIHNINYYFYDKIRVNQTESVEIEEWINQVRIDLKKNIIRKQNRDINNREIYAYLHDIFGAEVINIFDIKYDEDKKETT